MLISDVVYDKTVIPSLVSVLKNLLSSGTKRRACAFIASTVRNEDTRDQFLIYMCKFVLFGYTLLKEKSDQVPQL